MRARVCACVPTISVSRREGGANEVISTQANAINESVGLSFRDIDIDRRSNLVFAIPLVVPFDSSIKRLSRSCAAMFRLTHRSVKEMIIPSLISSMTSKRASMSAQRGDFFLPI